MNYEGRVEAESELEAYKIMEDSFENGKGLGDLIDFDGADTQLDVGNRSYNHKGELDAVPNGAYIEEEV